MEEVFTSDHRRILLLGDFISSQSPENYVYFLFTSKTIAQCVRGLSDTGRLFHNGSPALTLLFIGSCTTELGSYSQESPC